MPSQRSNLRQPRLTECLGGGVSAWRMNQFGSFNRGSLKVCSVQGEKESPEQKGLLLGIRGVLWYLDPSIRPVQPRASSKGWKPQGAIDDQLGSLVRERGSMWVRGLPFKLNIECGRSVLAKRAECIFTPFFLKSRRLLVRSRLILLTRGRWPAWSTHSVSREGELQFCAVPLEWASCR